MSKKELTPLEALWKIDHTICMNFNDKRIKWNIDKPEDYPDGGYDEKDTDCKSFDDFCDCYDEIEKSLKALEIIVKKCCIDFEHKVINNGVDVYWMILNGVLTIELYKEEYDLFKEVLCSNSADKDMIKGEK